LKAVKFFIVFPTKPSPISLGKPPFPTLPTNKLPIVLLLLFDPKTLSQKLLPILLLSKFKLKAE
jgi:hypothetical protein